MRESARVLMLTLALALMSGALGTPARAQESQPALKVGDKVPAVGGPGAATGQMRSVDYSKAKATVLLFFMPDCPHCHKMIPEWNRAFERKPAGIEIVALMLGKEPPGFFELFPIKFPVLRYDGRDAAANFKLHTVPLMVRVGKTSLVEDVAQGVIDPIRVGEIFRP